MTDDPAGPTDGEGGAIRWALAGYGSGGRIFHAPLIVSTPALQLVAVVTRSPERAERVRRDLPGAAVVPDLEELAGLGARGVTISTPPATHAPLAHQALKAGLDVVLDKPFAPTAVEAAALAEDARRRRRLLVPYFNRRWDNDFLTLRRLVDSGRLGTVHRLTSRLDRCRPVKPGWPSDPDAGGGTLLDLGPHLIDQALRLLGPAVTVFAELDTRRTGARGRGRRGGPAATSGSRGAGVGSEPRGEPSGERIADDDVQVLLRHASGARSTLVAGLASPATGPRFLVQGSEAGVRIEGFDIQEAQLKDGSSPLSLSDRWGVDPQAEALITDLDGVVETVSLDRGRWDTFYPSVAAAMRGVGAPPADPQDAVEVARVIDAARESTRTGRVVVLGPR